MSDLNERLNKILDRITSDDFSVRPKAASARDSVLRLRLRPEAELAVREHIAFVLSQFHKRRPELRVNTSTFGSFLLHTSRTAVSSIRPSPCSGQGR